MKQNNCNTCGVELTDTNWSLSWRKVDRTQCIKCSKNNNTKSNPTRMYVNGTKQEDIKLLKMQPLRL